ncbi:hypothetical protein GCM10027289_27790 [Tsukamurella serpentis]
MTPADQEMERVVAAQAKARHDDPAAVIGRLNVELDRAADDRRCLMAQVADMGGRVRQIASPLCVALMRDDLDELGLREVIAAAVDALDDASAQPARVLSQLADTWRAER